MMKINIVGCGRLGKTIARSLAAVELVEIQGILNRTFESSQEAVDYVGAGFPLHSFDELTPTGCTILACSDDNIQVCCEQLVAAGAVRPGSSVFHCSGAYCSVLLESAAGIGANTGSLHPVKSFADLDHAYSTLAGTLCGIEGDDACTVVMETIATACGMSTFNVDPESKLHYHAGSVLVCNYLVALLEAGYQCFEQAGVDRDTASRLIEPFVADTLNNVQNLGTSQALTGPIARGDNQLVAKQYQTVASNNPRLGDVYRSLGLIATELSTQQGSAAASNVAAIIEAFE